ncbi:hypothetical protein ACSFA0_24960 [Variovorax sp. LT1P1]|uniref:hypothetical protein n=1 Tax=Variovorax sp. LT1P1 TaxID=3443730 RepID=UPI003F453A47
MARSQALTARTTCYVEGKQQATHAFVLRDRLKGTINSHQLMEQALQTKKSEAPSWMSPRYEKERPSLLQIM